MRRRVKRREKKKKDDRVVGLVLGKRRITGKTEGWEEEGTEKKKTSLSINDRRMKKRGIG